METLLDLNAINKCISFHSILLHPPWPITFHQSGDSVENNVCIWNKWSNNFYAMFNIFMQPANIAEEAFCFMEIFDLQQAK